MGSRNYSLEYYENSSWTDITSYVIEISDISYGADRRTYGMDVVFEVILAPDASYGTNRFKLTIGSHYMYYKAIPESIENLDNYRVGITLVDKNFYNLKQLPPTYPSGTEATEHGGTDLTFNFIKSTDVVYETGDGSFSANGFEEVTTGVYKDKHHNTITYSTAPSYFQNGVVKVRNIGGTVKEGIIFPTYADILSGISVTYSEINGISSESDTNVTFTMQREGQNINWEKVWDVKTVNNHILVLGTTSAATNHLELISFDTDGNYCDHVSYIDRSWDENSTGTWYLGYQIAVDPYNNNAYIPFYYTGSFDCTSSNIFTLRIAKIVVGSNGNLSETYDDNYADADVTDVHEEGSTCSDWEELREREGRWTGHGAGISHLTGNLQASHMAFYITSDRPYFVYTHPANNEIYVIEPDRHANSQQYWIKQYSLSTGSVMIDYENGVGYSDGNLFRIDSVVGFYLATGNSFYVESTGVTSKQAMWRDWVTDKVSNGHYNWLPQLYNGIANPVDVENDYTGADNDYMGSNLTSVDAYSGASWNEETDRALFWVTDSNASPTDLTFNIRDNYVLRRLYLYQPVVYTDRLQQFIDLFVSFGFFYEQNDGEAKLIRIDGNNTNVGTIQDSHILAKKNITGHSEYADNYTISLLDTDVEFAPGTGDTEKKIQTKIGEYGWMSARQVAALNEWTTYLRADLPLKEIHLTIDDMNSALSTYKPSIGDKVTYSSTDYYIISVTLDINNWIAKLILMEVGS